MQELVDIYAWAAEREVETEQWQSKNQQNPYARTHNDQWLPVGNSVEYSTFSIDELIINYWKSKDQIW